MKKFTFKFKVFRDNPIEESYTFLNFKIIVRAVNYSDAIYFADSIAEEIYSSEYNTHIEDSQEKLSLEEVEDFEYEND